MEIWFYTDRRGQLNHMKKKLFICQGPCLGRRPLKPHGLCSPGFLQFQEFSTYTHKKKTIHRTDSAQTPFIKQYAHLREKSLETLQQFVLTLPGLQKKPNQLCIFLNAKQSWCIAGKMVAMQNMPFSIEKHSLRSVFTHRVTAKHSLHVQPWSLLML